MAQDADDPPLVFRDMPSIWKPDDCSSSWRMLHATTMKLYWERPSAADLMHAALSGKSLEWDARTRPGVPGASQDHDVKK